MSQEITTTIKVTAAKGNVNETIGITSNKTDMAATTPRTAKMIQTIATSNTELKIPTEIGTPGYLYVRNRDATNYCELGPTSDGTTGGTFYPFVHLGPGDAALIPLAVASTACCAKANTLAVELEWQVLTR